MAPNYTRAVKYIRAIGGQPPKKLSPRWLARVRKLEELEARLA